MSTPHLVRDRQLVEELGGIISVSTLRKDRRTHQLVPFIRFGRLCLYDVDAVRAAIVANSFGGQQKKSSRRG